MDKPVLKTQLSASSIEEGEELLKKVEVLLEAIRTSVSTDTEKSNNIHLHANFESACCESETRIKNLFS